MTEENAPVVDWSAVRRFVPKLQIISYLRNYSWGDLAGDVPSGLVIGIMTIPQGMAYSILAGLPPEYGLFASMYSIPLYTLFSTSPHLAVGPTALLAILNAEAVSELVEEGTDDFIRLSMVMAFLIGVLQLVMGLVHAGYVVNFLSHPVLKGFTFAAAIIIGTSQLSKMFGVTVERSQYAFLTWGGIVSELAKGNGHGLTMAIGFSSLAMFYLLAWSKTFVLSLPRIQESHVWTQVIKSIPNALIVVVVFTSIAFAQELDVAGVSIVGKIPSGVPPLNNFFVSSSSEFLHLLPTAFVATVIGFMESISVSKANALKFGYTIDANQELVGLGLANLFSFLNIFPVTGGFSRSMVLADAGGKTPISGIFTAIILFIVVFFLTDLFTYLPLPTLAALIIFAITKLFDITFPQHLYALNKEDFVVYLASLLATFGLGIELGIAVGVVISLLRLIYQSSIPHVAELGRKPGTTIWRNTERFPNLLETVPGIRVIRFDGPLFFANASYFTDLVENAAAGNKLFRSQQFPSHHEIFTPPSTTRGGEVGSGDDGAGGGEGSEEGRSAGGAGGGEKSPSSPSPSPPQSYPKAIVLDFSDVPHIDASGMEALMALPEVLEKASDTDKGRDDEKEDRVIPRVFLACVRGPVQDAIERHRVFQEHYNIVKQHSDIPSIWNCKYPCTITPPPCSSAPAIPTPKTKATAMATTRRARAPKEDADGGMVDAEGGKSPEEDGVRDADAAAMPFSPRPRSYTQREKNILSFLLQHQDIDHAVQFVADELQRHSESERIEIA